MARHPEWFGQLDAILTALEAKPEFEWLGRHEMQGVFGCSQRDSIRLLHKFGAVEREDVLSLPRTALVAQLQAIRGGTTYAAYLRQRREVAALLKVARAEASARQWKVAEGSLEERRTGLVELPSTIRWQRGEDPGPGRFEIRYADGADLLRQLADFLSAAAAHREEFYSGTEPGT